MALFDRDNPDHVKAEAFMAAVEAEERQRAVESIERYRKNPEPGMLIEEFARLHGIPLGRRDAAV